MALTEKGGTCTPPSRPARRSPLAPKVMITRRIPPAKKFSQHISTGVVDILHGQSHDRLGFRLVGNEVVEIFQRA